MDGPGVAGEAGRRCVLSSVTSDRPRTQFRAFLYVDLQHGLSISLPNSLPFSPSRPPRQPPPSTLSLSAPSPPASHTLLHTGKFRGSNETVLAKVETKTGHIIIELHTATQGARIFYSLEPWDKVRGQCVCVCVSVCLCVCVCVCVCVGVGEMSMVYKTRN